MAILYPGDPPGSATDDFTVPSNPVGTPLSEAGTGTRNLTGSIGDEGLAIMALQSWASLRTHDHSGDGSSTATGGKLAQANTHQSADTDAAQTSIHHTIDPTGTSANQVAAANHVHDYNGPTIVNAPFHKCLSTDRPASPTPGDLIWETDKNTMRVWAEFSGSNVASVGLYTTDDFSYTNATELNPTNWSQVYYPNTSLPEGYTSISGGVMASPTGQYMEWVANYVGFNWPFPNWPWPYVQGRCIAQRILNADRHTDTDNQLLTWQAGPTVMTYPSSQLWPPTPSSNDFYLRMSDDTESYLRISYTYNPPVAFHIWLVLLTLTIPTAPAQEVIQVYYTTNGIAGETLLGGLTIPGFNPYANYQASLNGTEIDFYVNSNFVGKVVDSSGVSAIGSSNRGWGVGMTVARSSTWPVTEYHHPSLVNQVWINDIAYYTGSALWQLLPVGSRPVCRYVQTAAQPLSSAGTLITWDTIEEDTFNFLNPAASLTNVVVSEPGVYDIDIAIQWDTTIAPAIGNVVMLKNGQPTEVRNQATLKGGLGVAPGFSQTLYAAGKLRLAENDILSVQVYYSAISGLGVVNTYAQHTEQIVSRFELTFLSP